MDDRGRAVLGTMDEAELVVDLSEPPERRWRLSADQREQARALVSFYKEDLGLRSEISARVLNNAPAVCTEEHWHELCALSASLGVARADLVLSNLYYDVMKLALGCSALAVDTDHAVLHARNLDWSSAAGALGRFTLVTRFRGAPAGEFLTVGWPGFAGVFSGMAPGRFALSLNSVLSRDAPELATPVVFLLRSVLEHARSFDEALAAVASTTIASDCIVLLSGVTPGQLAVIERTPARYAVRMGTGGFVAATNDYLLLNARRSEMPTSRLAESSVRRLLRLEELAHGRRFLEPSQLLQVLADPGVELDMTVQQMAFCAASGAYVLNLPSR